MIIVRSFLASAPFEPLEHRLLESGAMTIGRDPACDWSLADAGAKISRHHCTITCVGDRLSIVDLSTNGVEIGMKRQNLSKDEPYDLAIGDAIYIGDYILTTELADDETPEEADATGGPGVSREQITQAELLASFCEGAGLEPGAYAGQDAQGVMWRLGGIYRQVIEDMCDMLRDRALFKAELHLDRTTVGGWKNNPFKWAPASSIAVDLVKGTSGGFLKGAEAIAESFRDLRGHCDALAKTGKGSSRIIMETLSPEQVRAAVGPGASAEELLKEYEARIHRLMTEIENGDEFLSDAYREALKGDGR